MDRTDGELIKAYKEGAGEAIDILVRRHIGTVFSFARRLAGDEGLAQDITQETFLKAWKNLKKYDTEKSFKTWLLSICHNSAMDQLRKKKSLLFSEINTLRENEDFDDSLPDPEPLPDKAFEQKELAAKLETALASLPLDRREIVLLHARENLTFEEIAVLSGKPMNTVKSQYRRAIAALRNKLMENGKFTT